LSVTKLCRSIGRTNDIYEHNRGEKAVWVRAMANAGHKLFDLVEDRVLVPYEREMIRTRKFDVLCSWNVKRQMTRSLHTHRNIVGSVENQRAGVNRSKQVPYIVFRFHPLQRGDSAGTRALPFESCKPLPLMRLRGDARGEHDG